MKVFLTHMFTLRGAYGELLDPLKGWIEGELVEGDERCNIINKEGNFLVKGATPGFIQRLREKNLLTSE